MSINMEEIYNLQFHKVIDSILNTVKEIAVIIDIAIVGVIVGIVQ